MTLATDNSTISLPADGRSVTTLTAYIGNNAVFNIADYGVVNGGNATSALTQIFATAISGKQATVQFNAGIYLLDSTFTIPSNWTIQGAGVTATTLQRTSDTAMFTITAANSQCIRNVTIDCGGINYTSPVMTIVDNGFYLHVEDVYFDNVAAGSSAIEFSQAAGPYCNFENVRFDPLGSSSTVPMILFSDTADGSPRYRRFVSCDAYNSTPLLNTGGQEITWIVNCAMAYLLFGANSRKVMIANNRIATAGTTMTVSGIDHVFVGNEIAGPVTFDTTTADVLWGANISGAVTDNGTGSGTSRNRIWVTNDDTFLLLGRKATSILSLQGSKSGANARIGFVTDDTGYSWSLGKISSSGGAFTALLTLLDGSNKGLVALGSPSGPTLSVSSTSPEGTITAPVSSLHVNTSGSGGNALYIKVTGSGNTGWLPVSVVQAGAAITSTVAFSNGAGGNTGTLTNAPTSGNPTKWIPINDNGTTRYVPAW